MNIRAPITVHSFLAVCAFSFASTYYTLYPWIAEQKEKRRLKNLDTFHELVAQDPQLAAQWHDNARNKETAFETTVRKFRTKELHQSSLSDEYYEARGKFAPTMPNLDALYTPLAPGEELIEAPTVESVLLGRVNREDDVLADLKRGIVPPSLQKAVDEHFENVKLEQQLEAQQKQKDAEAAAAAAAAGDV